MSEAVVGVRCPNSGIRSGKKLMERMETSPCRHVSFCLVPPCVFLAWFGSLFPFFGRFTFSLVPQALGLRLPFTRRSEQGLLPVRLLDTKPFFFAPSRCCCVQMARSYQACLTSASVNTTRCLVDVLISAWSKKNVNVCPPAMG